MEKKTCINLKDHINPVWLQIYILKASVLFLDHQVY